MAREVTHIVVETKHRKGLGRLVPLDFLDDAGDQVTLTCDVAVFKDPEVAEKIQFMPWASSALTDIQYQGQSPGKDVQNGDHGEEEAAPAPLVHSGVQG